MRVLFGWLVALAILGGGGYAAWHYYESSQPPEVRFELAELDRGPIQSKVTATGTVSALVTVQVGSQVTGRIQRLYADFNDRVRRGQLIAKIDPLLFEAAVAQARANVAAARGSLAVAEARAFDAEKQVERARLLAARDFIPKADLDTSEAGHRAAQAQIESAKGALEQAKAALRHAEINLQYTYIRSPTNGVVVSRNVDVGQTVAAALQAPTLFLIAEDLRKMQVDTNVAEGDVGKLRPKMEARFTVDAYPGEQFRGTVRQIRHAPQTLQNVVTYDAVIDVANNDLKLRPGMTANVRFVYAERKEVLRIPNAALRFRPPPDLVSQPAEGGNSDGGPPAAARPRGKGRPGGKAGPGAGGRRSGPRTVWIAEGGSLRPVQIRTGITDGRYTEVLDGPLRAGDSVVVDVTRSRKDPRRRRSGWGTRRLL